jgi:hypothetical protein
MKPLSEVAPGLLEINTYIQAVCNVRVKAKTLVVGKSEDCRLRNTAKVRPAELPTSQEFVIEE